MYFLTRLAFLPDWMPLGMNFYNGAAACYIRSGCKVLILCPRVCISAVAETCNHHVQYKNNLYWEVVILLKHNCNSGLVFVAELEAP